MLGIFTPVFEEILTLRIYPIGIQVWQGSLITHMLYSLGGFLV